MERTWRGILQATVSRDGAYIEEHFGSMTFTQLWHNVKPGHRYAIAKVGEELWVVDMYRSHMSADTWEPEMGPYKIFPTLDAAICATILTYDQD